MSSLLHLSMHVVPSFPEVDLVREGVDRLVTAALGSALGAALALVSRELLENAVKYRATGAGLITFSLDHEGDRVSVRVVNGVDERAPHVASLRERIAWLGSFPDASQAYMAALEGAFERPGVGPDDGKLGLARVAFEGGCAVSVEAEGAGRVAVRAVRSVGGVGGGVGGGVAA